MEERQKRKKNWPIIDSAKQFQFYLFEFFFPRKTIDIFAWLFLGTSRSSSFDLEKSTMDR